MLERIKKINFSQIDYVILFCMTVLIGVGLYSIYQSDVHKAKPSSLFTSQVLGIGLGLGVFIVLLFIDYQFICKFAWLYYIGINGLLLLTLRSKPINYVRRWITLGEIQFQTSELAKVVMIIVISYLCNKLKNRMNKFYVFFILCAVMVIPIVLILKEPHLSSTVAFFVIFCVMLFSAGLSYKIIITMALIVTIGFGGIFFGVTKLKLNIPFIKDYMIGRIENFLASDSEENKDAKRQTNKAVVAIHSGGAYGKMLDPKEKDTDRKYGNIYANESDFIFSVVGEEFGFIGCTIILFMLKINYNSLKQKEYVLTHYKGWLPFQIEYYLDLYERNKFLKSIGLFDKVQKVTIINRNKIKSSKKGDVLEDDMLRKWIKDNPNFADIVYED